jgi:hypothetical protein
MAPGTKSAERYERSGHLDSLKSPQWLRLQSETATTHPKFSTASPHIYFFLVTSKRATLIIRALHIAVKNAPRVKFGIQEPVTKIPEYAAPTPEHEAIAQQSELPAVSAIPYKPVEPHDSHFWEYQAEGTRILAREAQARKAAKTQAAARTDRVETDRVGTGAFARPAQAKPNASVGTDALVRPGREATVPPPATITTTKVTSPPAAVSPHNFKKPPRR